MQIVCTTRAYSPSGLGIESCAALRRAPLNGLERAGRRLEHAPRLVNPTGGASHAFVDRALEDGFADRGFAVDTTEVADRSAA